jgi:hypothetical protein
MGLRKNGKRRRMPEKRRTRNTTPEPIL